MNEFLSMGGYAWYVWGSYGVTFLLLAVEIILLSHKAKKP
jgi:heme exporter protein D